MTIPRFCIDEKMSEFRDHRPENYRPRMNRSERAKQFAPYAALGRMDRLLKKVEANHDTGDPERIADLTDFQLSETEFDVSLLEADDMDGRN